MAAQRQSSYVSVARAGLTAGAALALTRVYAGGAWIAPVLFGAFLAPLTVAFAERRRWHPLIGLALTLATGAWLAVLVDDPSETVVGIPTASALSALRADLANAPHVLRSATVPVDPHGAALLLAVVAAFVAAFATELIARRLEAPIGAIGPSVALYVAISALGSHAWAATTACYAIVVVAYLVALQYAELSTRRTWFQAHRTRRSQVVNGGIMGGAVVVAVAIIVGPSFPGARGAALINYRSLGAGNGGELLQTESPLASVAAKLSGAHSNAEVFTVKVSDSRKFKWRVIALDEFSTDPRAKDNWSSNALRNDKRSLPGPTRGPGTTLVTQHFQLGGIDPYWLPAVYRPVKIDLAGVTVLANSTSSLFLGGGSLQHISYDVQSEVSSPDLATLESVTFDDLKSDTHDTKMPSVFPDDAAALAHQKTLDARTPYDQAVALENFFQRSGLFTYDQKVDLGATPSALHTFLFQVHRGFCEQFAAAFAELARSIGLPARVAVGYQSGEFNSKDGLYHVRNRDAHAWPEVWLGPKIGWYAFEPTPGRSDDVTGRGDPSGTTTPTSPTGTTPTTPGVSTPATKAAQKPTPPGVKTFTPPPAKTGSSSRHHTVTGLLVALAVALAALLGALVTLVATALRRSRQRRHDPDTRRRVLGAWTEALERLTAAGVERRTSATSVEFALRQAPAHGAGAAGPPLMDLARLHTAAMYSPDPPSSDDADAAWSHVDDIAAALRTTVTRTNRWKTRLRIAWRGLSETRGLRRRPRAARRTPPAPV